MVAFFPEFVTRVPAPVLRELRAPRLLFRAASTPLPETVIASPGGEQNHCQQAEDQQFHGVIDEGNPDLFRKIFDLKDGRFFDGPAFGKPLHIQLFGVEEGRLAVEDQVRQNAAGGG